MEGDALSMEGRDGGDGGRKETKGAVSANLVSLNLGAEAAKVSNFFAADCRAWPEAAAAAEATEAVIRPAFRANFFVVLFIWAGLAFSGALY